MSEEGGLSTKGEWATPYARVGGFHSLSGSALAAVAREVLSRGHSFRFLAPGASMFPFIHNGDVVTLVPFDAGACAPGVVVAFVRPEHDRLVVHRVISVAGDQCCTRGDNNSADDGDVPFSAIIGTVDHVERGGGSVGFGFGPEGILIAFLSRRGWLCRGMRAVGAVCSVTRRHL